MHPTLSLQRLRLHHHTHILGIWMSSGFVPFVSSIQASPLPGFHPGIPFLFSGETVPVFHYLWQAQGLSLSYDPLTIARAHGRSQGTVGGGGSVMNMAWTLPQAAPTAGCPPSPYVRLGSRKGLYLEKQLAMCE